MAEANLTIATDPVLKWSRHKTAETASVAISEAVQKNVLDRWMAHGLEAGRNQQASTRRVFR